MNTSIKQLGQLLAFAAALAAHCAAHAEILNLYVAVDGRPTLTSGTYSGLANPNHQRLLLLFAHPSEDDPTSNHFHGIGAYSYGGPADSPTVVDTNGNNRLPETFTAQPPNTLKPGAGLYAGKLTSGENGEHYSDKTLAAIHDLASYPANSAEWYLFNSNAGYTNTQLTGLDLAIELISISPGLHLGVRGLESPGDVLPIGGPDDLPFEPVFWTDAGAAPDAYAAEFRLVDQSGTFDPSGRIHFDFAVTVPEPGTAFLALLSAIIVCALVARRDRSTPMAR